MTPNGWIIAVGAAGEHHVGVAAADEFGPSPMACVPAEHAVVMVLFGPRASCWMATCAAARLGSPRSIEMGFVRSRRRRCERRDVEIVGLLPARRDNRRGGLPGEQVEIDGPMPPAPSDDGDAVRVHVAADEPRFDAEPSPPPRRRSARSGSCASPSSGARRTRPRSKRVSSTSAAMRVSNPSQSKAVIGPQPERPARSASVNSARPMPIGVTTPMPVMATRSRIGASRRDTDRARCRRSVPSRVDRPAESRAGPTAC